MQRVDFYKLTRDPAEKILPVLAMRLLDQGGRLLIVAASAMLRQEIGAALWSHQPASFLPHGAAGSADEAMEPILIAGAWQLPAVNNARNVAIADGEWHQDALQFDRAFLLFDDSNIDQARATWRNLATLDGVERHFWQQNDQGKWSELG